MYRGTAPLPHIPSWHGASLSMGTTSRFHIKQSQINIGEVINVKADQKLELYYMQQKFLTWNRERKLSPHAWCKQSLRLWEEDTILLAAELRRAAERGKSSNQGSAGCCHTRQHWWKRALGLVSREWDVQGYLFASRPVSKQRTKLEHTKKKNTSENLTNKKPFCTFRNALYCDLQRVCVTVSYVLWFCSPRAVTRCLKLWQ
jgi:hypothetical protein